MIEIIVLSSFGLISIGAIAYSSYKENQRWMRKMREFKSKDKN